MSTVVKGNTGSNNSLLLKGAPERVITKCSSYKNAAGKVEKLTDDAKERLIRGAQDYAA